MQSLTIMPSPLDIPPIEGVNPKTDEEERDVRLSDNAPFSALAFKIMTDPYVGKTELSSASTPATVERG